MFSISVLGSLIQISDNGFWNVKNGQVCSHEYNLLLTNENLQAWIIDSKKVKSQKLLTVGLTVFFSECVFKFFLFKYLI